MSSNMVLKTAGLITTCLFFLAISAGCFFLRQHTAFVAVGIFFFSLALLIAFNICMAKLIARWLVIVFIIIMPFLVLNPFIYAEISGEITHPLLVFFGALLVIESLFFLMHHGLTTKPVPIAG